MTDIPPSQALTEEAYRAVERAARDSYGRLVAFLATRSHDVAAAEDALADAFHSALEDWPKTGVPAKPEAWLLTAARRRLMDGVRHARVHQEALPGLRAAVSEAHEMTTIDTIFPDERLKLLFICAHPAIDPAAHTALMLQTVLGLNAARIASAFLVRPSAMGQRLSRAKAKIRDAGLRFEMPEPQDLVERLNAVLEAIYAAYGSGWEDVAGADGRRKGLALEAIELGRLMLLLLPGEPEVEGLLALMLHCEARHDARRAPTTGAYVPLLQQDVTLWSKPMIDEAERHLCAASQSCRIGRFQLEAAIQSVHAQRARTTGTDWQAIALMYEGLVRLAPTVGALVGRAAAIAEARGPALGWALLEVMPVAAIQSYQPYWALAAELLTRMLRFGEASAAYSRAIGLCEDPAVREFLRSKAQQELI